MTIFLILDVFVLLLFALHCRYAMFPPMLPGFHDMDCKVAYAGSPYMEIKRFQYARNF
ncbi:hypothetical protein SAMN05216316_0558 [Nitrosovibrio sp. Nv6]|nr:hypothetical protein SAMN05216316_0558 [Nitrosovibrio sp. Nv6]